ncbi:MAG: tyrosine-type recombinase/integrase [Candidatus Bathyarchaeota archaeon]|jgi:site-specific recombinase XerD
MNPTTIREYINQRISESKYLGEPTANWLSEYSSRDTVYSHCNRFEQFLQAIDKTDVQIVTEYKQATDKDQFAKEYGKVVLKYYHDYITKGYSSNTARSATSSIRAFFTSQTTSLRIKRRSIRKTRRAQNQHTFTQAELKKMFYVADIRDKAILSTGVSLGYASKDFLGLKRQFIESLVRKAEKNKTEFIAFEYSRGKTNEPAFSFLTPEAVSSLSAYLEISNKNSEWLWHNHMAENHITNRALNDIIQKLARKANITTTGKISFHLLRKFLMSSSVESGFNTFEAQYLIGHSIPTSDSTYLMTLNKSITEKLPELYKRITLTGYVNGSKNNKIEQLEAQVETQQQALTGFVDLLTKYMKNQISKKDTATEIAKIKALEKMTKGYDKLMKEEQEREDNQED